MPANYNKTAWFYDGLSTLVYGRSLINAQGYLLKYIQPYSHILIIGGGTGIILESIAKKHPGSLSITYVEVAEKMITRARKRNTGGNKINFVHSAIEDVDTPGEFDIVITPFLFDNYSDEVLKTMVPHISRQLKPGGLWLNTDFQFTGKWWQWLLLKGMYAFFKLFSDIPTSRIPDIKQCLSKAGCQLIEEKDFYSGFVQTQAWRKALNS
ncbi:methyltransferase type 12 [Mucilaginibacter hurinus]|uniref:Methyltransferase type 12 n=1 Tax=Mucilaginibacter hurinus TaxID=2201324 RepID=A0A367GQ48_9SPHI|nr:class I SAM-dependent methyltransferase [Mucilaginibacter hurinus]RCH54833.1 methyltransferase type 12 [Mucilaginibacter hurinus]